MSKLLRVCLRLGSERKLLPAMLALGVGQNADSLAASASTAGKTFSLPAALTIGKPHIPFGFMAAKGFALPLAILSVRRVLKISPTNVLFPLQSSAVWLVGIPVFGSTAIAGTFVSCAEKSPPIIAGVGIKLSRGVACRMRSPS